MGKPTRHKQNFNLFGKGQQQRKGGDKQGPKGKDRDPAKWLHHSLKTIHKALKQAKNFEIRKITRRLAQARTQDAVPQNKSGPEAVQKLEQQLTAAKQADLDKLAQQAAAKAGLVVTGTPAPVGAEQADAATAAAAAAGGAPSDLAAAVQQRLLAAACVQKQLAEQLTEFKRRFGQTSDEQQQPGGKRQKTDPAASSGAAAAAAALSGEPISSDDLSSGSATADDGADDDGGIDLEAEYDRLQQLEQQQQQQLEQQQQQQLEQQQQQQQHVGPPADYELDEATLDALEKLRARSRAFESDSDAEDSGIIMGPDDASFSHSDADSAGDELDSDDSQQQQQRSTKRQQQTAGKEGQSGAAQSQEAAAAAGDSDRTATAAVVYPGPPPGNAPKQQQQQQQSKYEKLQAKKRAKLEKLLKRGKRIGQRMRRQLYEKLYGMDANHLKVEQHSGRKGGRGYGQPYQESHKEGRSQRPVPDKQQRGQHGAAHKEQRHDAGHMKQPADSSKQQQQQQQELHPSWAARKQQQQQVIKVGAAAAKKVVFGVDGETVRQVQLGTQQQQQQQRPVKAHNNGKPERERKSQRSGSQQALPAGSRNAGSGKPPDKLHPSWQAKKQQQVVISAQPTGKKMTFHD